VHRYDNLTKFIINHDSDDHFDVIPPFYTVGVEYTPPALPQKRPNKKTSKNVTLQTSDLLIMTNDCIVIRSKSIEGLAC